MDLVGNWTWNITDHNYRSIELVFLQKRLKQLLLNDIFKKSCKKTLTER